MSFSANDLAKAMANNGHLTDAQANNVVEGISADLATILKDLVGEKTPPKTVSDLGGLVTEAMFALRRMKCDER